MLSSLSASTKPQSLSLPIEDEGPRSNKDLENSFLPLVKLPKNIILQITGIDHANPAGWSEDVRDAKAADYKHDLLANALDVHMKQFAAWRWPEDYPDLAGNIARSTTEYFSLLVNGLHWGCIHEDRLNCFNAVALAEEAIRVRILAAKLKQVSGEYWWSWDSIQDDPVGVLTDDGRTLLDVFGV